jgi:predicted DNA-binding WGR domain protein
MAKLAWVGENYDNLGGTSSKGHIIRQSRRSVIFKWGPIEVIGGQGGKFHWVGTYPRVLRKTFPSTAAAAAHVSRTIKSKQAAGYDKLPGRVSIRAARKKQNDAE